MENTNGTEFKHIKLSDYEPGDILIVNIYVGHMPLQKIKTYLDAIKKEFGDMFDAFKKKGVKVCFLAKRAGGKSCNTTLEGVATDADNI